MLTNKSSVEKKEAALNETCIQQGDTSKRLKKQKKIYVYNFKLFFFSAEISVRNKNMVKSVLNRPSSGKKNPKVSNNPLLQLKYVIENYTKKFSTKENKFIKITFGLFKYPKNPNQIEIGLLCNFQL